MGVGVGADVGAAVSIDVGVGVGDRVDVGVGLVHAGKTETNTTSANTNAITNIRFMHNPHVELFYCLLTLVGYSTEIPGLASRVRSIAFGGYR
jgi:hypothetical protein